MPPILSRNLGRLLALAAVGVLLTWSWRGMDVDLSHVHLAKAGEYVRDMFPPNLKILPKAWSATVVTLQMAVLGTFFGFVAALPVSFLAARTSALPRAFSGAVKTGLNVLRAIPPLIYAVLFVYVVGLGPLPGALGIGVGSFVMLAKLFAESLESVHPAPIEAVKAVGGRPLQVFTFGMLPQALPQFLSHTLYAWELNISAATIVGIVGAGGIGFEMKAEFDYFAWQNVSVYVILLVALVLIADAVSYQIRKRVT